MNSEQYSLSDFYLMLKLGIFRSGKVENRGYFSSGETNEFFLRKSLTEYQNQLHAKKQLAIGLYLLDSYLLANNNNMVTYMLIISVCRTSLQNKEKIYVLRFSDVPAGVDIMTIMSEGVSSRSHKPMFRKS